MKHIILYIFGAYFLLASCGQQSSSANAGTAKTDSIATAIPATDTKAITTADEALAALKAGNQRFLEGRSIHTDHKAQIEKTKTGQKPHTIFLSCMDSRVPPEIVFDQGIGDVFVTRVAGNIADPNMLGSMEYATQLTGTKLIVVMGHSHCGAIKGAIADAQLGNLTQLLAQIKPAVSHDTTDHDKQIDETARNNVKMTMDHILKNSKLINDMVKKGTVKITGAFYDIETGKVDFIQ